MKLPVFEIPIYKYEIENWEENKESDGKFSQIFYRREILQITMIIKWHHSCLCMQTRCLT